MIQLINLRPALDSDSDVLFEWINNRDLVVFNAPFRTISSAEHDAWFARIRTEESATFFIIEDVKTGIAIGSCQLLNIHPTHRSAELQIRIGAIDFQNLGAGSEAVGKLTDYGFKVLNLRRISLHVFATNTRAIRTYEKNGYIHEGRLRQAIRINECWVDVICMAKIRGVDD
ncbi:GNAT family protein [Polynucleobacter sp. UK-FUSCHL-C3]|uniref:GNAT family N-acetyltransferase n=1 Tax=Polynucleobacter sp. UK-FUSCHL-C3 TaxID=2955208 RepID=A0AAU8A482_9BURK